MGTPTIETLARRVDRLDEECRALRRQARGWKLGGGAALAGLVLVALCGARQEEKLDVKEADVLHLKSREGVKSLGLLEASGIRLTDKAGNSCHLSPKQLMFRDARGQERLTLHTSGDGSGSVILVDRDGHHRARLASNPDGSTYLRITGKETFLGVTIGLKADGTPDFRLDFKEGPLVLAPLGTIPGRPPARAPR